MNTPSFLAAVRAALAEAMPGLDVRPHISTDEVNRAAPYVVLTATAEQELVRGNHTWELDLAVELHANAYELPGAEQQQLFRTLCSTFNKPQFTETLNTTATDFYLYSLRLQAIDEPRQEDKSHIQAARLRGIIQY